MIYAKAMVLLAVLCAIGVAIYKYGTYRENLVRVEYQQRDLKAAQDYAAKEREITQKYRSQEENWQQQFAAASKAYQRGLANAETQKLADAAAVDSGRIRLLDPGTVGKACGDSPPSVTASASGRNGSEGSELSPEFAKFLLAEASRADEYTLQLTACQEILINERK